MANKHDSELTPQQVKQNGQGAISFNDLSIVGALHTFLGGPAKWPSLPTVKMRCEPSDKSARKSELASGETKAIIWATGYRPDYSWLEVPVLDSKGRIQHDGGVVSSPGMYLMGAQFLRRRKSALIDGAGDDARDLSAHLMSYLDSRLARIRA